MQFTKRQLVMLRNGLEALDADLGKDAGFWDDEEDGEKPSINEIEGLTTALNGMIMGDPPDDTPMKDGKPYITEPDRVLNALLLTDAGMRADKPLGPTDIDLLENAIEHWTGDERAAAFEWAACSHLKAGDNDDVVVPPCPPHVEKLRPKYGSKK